MHKPCEACEPDSKTNSIEQISSEADGSSSGEENPEFSGT